MVDDSSAAAVLHQEHLDVLHVADVHAVKTVVAAVTISAVSAEADAGHLSGSLEATTHGVIDTMGLPPSVLYTSKKNKQQEVNNTILLLSLKAKRARINNKHEGGGCCCCCSGGNDEWSS